MIDGTHALPAWMTNGQLSADKLWEEARTILGEVLLSCGDPNTIAQLNDVPRARHTQMATNIRFSEEMTRRIVLLLAADRAKHLPPLEKRPGRPAPAETSALTRGPFRLADCVSDPPPPTKPGEDISHGCPPSPSGGGGGSPPLGGETEGAASQRLADVPAPPPPAPKSILDSYAPSSTWRGVSFAVITPRNKPRKNRNPTARERHARHRKERLQHYEEMGFRRMPVPRYAPKPEVLTAPLAKRAEAVRRVAENPEPVVERTARWLQRLREKNRVANLKRRLSVPIEAPRKRSYGWLCCGPLITALAAPLNKALGYLNSG
jgi:hypothetical protein